MRVRRFHKNYPDGKLCLSQKEVDACEAEGAVDAKWKVAGVVPPDLRGLVKEPVDNDNIIAKPVPKTVDTQLSADKKYCECGCGEVTKGGRFLNLGHYNRWKAAERRKGVTHGDGPEHKPPD